ncbi:MAG: trypsin-like peptidase domain-containing protein [Butyrivibrio sp.]|nr:trypsin-like peptidase domain-containing protein [Butyrivibrio sp.]
MSKIFRKLITTLLAASLMLAPVSVNAQDEASLGLSLEGIEEAAIGASIEENENTDEATEEISLEADSEEKESDAPAADGEESEEELPVSTVESVEEAMNGVVQINTVFDDDSGKKHIIYGGTGILIGNPEKTEYVITNNHIVNPDAATKKAAYKYYKIPNKDNAWDNIKPYVEIVFENDVTVACSVVNSSDNLDLCVLSLSTPNLNRTPLTLLVQDPDEKKKPYSTTDSVYGLGFPEGVSYENPVFYSKKDVTMSSGKVANVTDYNGADLIQHNAQISVNNCGGPLLNDNGLVIGMNELTGDSNNYYSLDSTEIANILDSLGIEYNKLTQSEYEQWLHRNDVPEVKEIEKPAIQIVRPDPEPSKTPVWLIAVIIVLAVLVVALIAGFVFIMIRQNKRSESDDKKDKKKSQKSAQQAPTIDRFGRPVSQTLNSTQKPNPQMQIQSNAGSFAKGNETTTLNVPTQGEGTTVLGGSAAPAQANFLGTLIRRKNGENIVINKNDFTIGKDSLNIDFRIADNSAISRRHATIKQAGANIIIEDNFSTNGTFVNGTRLAEGQTSPIKSGDVIMLANEEFDYRI